MSNPLYFPHRFIGGDFLYILPAMQHAITILISLRIAIGFLTFMFFTINTNCTYTCVIAPRWHTRVYKTVWLTYRWIVAVRKCTRLCLVWIISCIRWGKCIITSCISAIRNIQQAFKLWNSFVFICDFIIFFWNLFYALIHLILQILYVIRKHIGAILKK